MWTLRASRDDRTSPFVPPESAAANRQDESLRVARDALEDRKLGTLARPIDVLALIAFVVGLTRLYLAVHWMTDVLGGWALAGVWGCLLIIPYLFTQRVATAPQDREARRPDRPRPRARPGRGTGTGRKPAGGKTADTGWANSLPTCVSGSISRAKSERLLSAVKPSP